MASNVTRKQVARARIRRADVALTPAGGDNADWLDDMILAGRMFIGSSPEEHEAACAQIRAERSRRTTELVAA